MFSTDPFDGRTVRLIPSALTSFLRSSPNLWYVPPSPPVIRPSSVADAALTAYKQITSSAMWCAMTLFTVGSSAERGDRRRDRPRRPAPAVGQDDHGESSLRVLQDEMIESARLAVMRQPNAAHV